MAYEEESKRAEEQEAASVAPVTDPSRPVVEEGNPSAAEEPVNEVNSNTAAQVEGFQGKDK